MYFPALLQTYMRVIIVALAVSLHGVSAVAYEAILRDDSSGANDHAAAKSTALRVRKTRTAFFRYDLYAEGLANADIRRATLKLHILGVAKAGTVAVGTAAVNWEEGDGNVPAAEKAIGTARLERSLEQQVIPIDVTENVREWVAQGREDGAFICGAVDELDVVFYSKESARAAVLEIEVAEGAAGPISFNMIRDRPSTLAGYGITDAAGKGANSDITSLSGLSTPITLAQGGTGANSPADARANLELGEPVHGLTNLTSAAYGPAGRGSVFPIILMGDSMTGGYILQMTRALQSAFGVAGRTLGAVNGVVANGATFNSGGTGESAAYWPTGTYYNLPTQGAIAFSDNVTGAIVSDTLRVYYVKEPGAGKFKVQTETDLSGAWADEDSVGVIDAASPSIAGGVVVIPTKSSARAYRMRVVGVNGTTKVIGATLKNSRASGVVIGWLYANSGVGGDLANGETILMGATRQSILSPILADVAPRAVFVHWRDAITDTPQGANYRSWRQLRERWELAYSATDWIMVGTVPYNVPGAPDQALANRAWREDADAHRQTDTYVDAYSCFGTGPAASRNGMLGPDGVHLTEQGSALLVNVVLDQLGVWGIAPQFLSRGNGDRLYSDNAFLPGVAATDVGQRAAFAIQGNRNGIKQLLFQNESEEQIGALSFTPENTPGGEGNEFVLSLGGVPSMKATLYGGFSFGFNAPAPGAQIDVYNCNPDIVAVRVNSPSAQKTDLTQWKRGDLLVAKLDRDGVLEAQGVRIGNSATRVTGLLSAEITLDPAILPAAGSVIWTLNVPGANPSGTPSVVLGWSAPLDPALVVAQAWVSAADTVSVRILNTTVRDIDLPPITVRPTVIQLVQP